MSSPFSTFESNINAYAPLLSSLEEAVMANTDLTLRLSKAIDEKEKLEREAAKKEEKIRHISQDLQEEKAQKEQFQESLSKTKKLYFDIQNELESCKYDLQEKTEHASFLHQRLIQSNKEIERLEIRCEKIHRVLLNRKRYIFLLKRIHRIDLRIENIRGRTLTLVIASGVLGLKSLGLVGLVLGVIIAAACKAFYELYQTGWKNVESEAQTLRSKREKLALQLQMIEEVKI